MRTPAARALVTPGNRNGPLATAHTPSQSSSSTNTPLPSFLEPSSKADRVRISTSQPQRRLRRPVESISLHEPPILPPKQPPPTHSSRRGSLHIGSNRVTWNSLSFRGIKRKRSGRDVEYNLLLGLGIRAGGYLWGACYTGVSLTG